MAVECVGNIEAGPAHNAEHFEVLTWFTYYVEPT
jgi:hypothetical protein